MKERPTTQGRNGARPDFARRQFLGGMGSMALLAGGFGVLTTSSARAAVSGGASLAGGSIGLELDGAFAGFLLSAAGGEPVFEVSAVPTGAASIDKSVASRHSLPLELAPAAKMSASFYAWIEAFTNGQAQTHSGALVQFDLNRKPVRRLVFNDAAIVAVAIPALDVSSAERFIPLNVTILPQASSIDLSSKGPTAPSTQEKTVLANGFRLQIRDLESASQNARRIEGLGMKTVAGPRGPSIDTGTLRITFPESSAAPFYQWFEQCGSKGCIERPGVIQFLSRDGTSTTGTIELVNLGITRVAPAWSISGDKLVSVVVDLYCEQQRFNLAGMASA